MNIYIYSKGTMRKRDRRTTHEMEIFFFYCNNRMRRTSTIHTGVSLVCTFFTLPSCYACQVTRRWLVVFFFPTVLQIWVLPPKPNEKSPWQDVAKNAHDYMVTFYSCCLPLSEDNGKSNDMKWPKYSCMDGVLLYSNCHCMKITIVKRLDLRPSYPY